MSEQNDARYQEAVEQALEQPMTQADWAIIKARFERVERDIAAVSARVVQAQDTANRADQGVHAHQPFIEHYALRAGDISRPPTTEAQPRPIDGRTLMVLSSWTAVLLTQFDFDTPATTTVEVTMTPDEQRELRSALRNVKYAMEHLKTTVGMDVEPHE